MARRVRDLSLESRASRAKLKARGKPYYRVIGEGLHLGYRKGERAGKWVVRRYIGEQNYKVETIATADDVDEANDETVLSFWQAQDRARARRDTPAPYRVRDAISAYLHYLGARGSGYDTRIRCEKHILPSLGDKLVGELTASEIRQWHRNLAQSLPLITTRETASQLAPSISAMWR